MQIIEINKRKFAPASAQQKAEVEEKIKKMRKEGEKMVKGMFEFADAQGGWLDFSYRFFKGDPIRTIKINHGEICDVPVMLAKHLNNCYKKVRMMPKELDESGRPIGKAPITKTSRTRFIPMDMLDPELIEAKSA
jgi:hypothetical protein